MNFPDFPADKSERHLFRSKAPCRRSQWQTSLASDWLGLFLINSLRSAARSHFPGKCFLRALARSSNFVSLNLTAIRFSCCEVIKLSLDASLHASLNSFFAYQIAEVSHFADKHISIFHSIHQLRRALARLPLVWGWLSGRFRPARLSFPFLRCRHTFYSQQPFFSIAEQRIFTLAASSHYLNERELNDHASINIF